MVLIGEVSDKQVAGIRKRMRAKCAHFYSLAWVLDDHHEERPGKVRCEYCEKILPSDMIPLLQSECFHDWFVFPDDAKLAGQKVCERCGLIG